MTTVKQLIQQLSEIDENLPVELVIRIDTFDHSGHRDSYVCKDEVIDSDLIVLAGDKRAYIKNTNGYAYGFDF